MEEIEEDVAKTKAYLEKHKIEEAISAAVNLAIAAKSDEPYRVIEAQALYEGPPPMDQVRGWRDELRGALRDLARAGAGEEDVIEQLFDKIDLMTMTNSLSASLPLDVLEKQSLLECPTVEARERRLAELLRFKTLEARLGMDAARPADA